MKKIYVAIILLGTLSTWSCKNEVTKEAETVTEAPEVVKEEAIPVQQSIAVDLVAKSGSQAMGKAYISEKDGKVIFETKIMGLKPGMHAIHLHEKADCSAEDGTSSGGHWNPTFENHGKWGAAEGYHRGDIGNFEVNENGIGVVYFETDQWCIGCGDEKRDILGKAIIVHEGTDDYTTQPTGNAGARVSCGGLIQ
jgi:superoxide dismutase, Cu-Zn family